MFIIKIKYYLKLGCKGTYLLNNVQYLKIMKFAIVICYDL